MMMIWMTLFSGKLRNDCRSHGGVQPHTGEDAEKKRKKVKHVFFLPDPSPPGRKAEVISFWNLSQNKNIKQNIKVGPPRKN